MSFGAMLRRACLVPMLFAALCAFSGCSHVFYQADRQQLTDPSKGNIPYQDVFFRASDGVRLHGWFFPAVGELVNGHAKGTVIQFHGNAQNMTAHFLSLIWMTEAGYNLLAFDYRGYGSSEGSSSQEGLNRDALAAIDYVLKKVRPAGGRDVVLYGQSLGGAVLSRAYEDVKDRSRIRAVIIESSFYSYRAIARDVLSRSWLTYILQPLACVLVSDAYSPEDAIPRISPTPLLVIHGSADRVVPMRFGEKIYELARAPKTLWRVPGGHHINAMFVDDGKYRVKLVKFLAGLPN